MRSQVDTGRGKLPLEPTATQTERPVSLRSGRCRRRCLFVATSAALQHYGDEWHPLRTPGTARPCLDLERRTTGREAAPNIRSVWHTLPDRRTRGPLPNASPVPSLSCLLPRLCSRLYRLLAPFVLVVALDEKPNHTTQQHCESRLLYLPTFLRAADAREI